MEKFVIRSLGRVLSQLRPHLLLGPINCVYLSVAVSCRRLPENKRNSSLFLH